ncbi:MAG: hypothetical protein ACOX3G_11100 [Armatimonadota bacterium]|jgi:uncharacterized membrane protein
MLRTLFALAFGLVVAITVMVLLVNQKGFGMDYLAVVLGAAISGLMLRSRQWLLGALVGVMFGGFMAACASLVFASFKRNYGLQTDYHVYLLMAEHIIGYAIVGPVAAEAAPKLRLMLRRRRSQRRDGPGGSGKGFP